MKLSRALARFFMLGIVPFLFTIVVTVALLMFLGVDVAQEVAKVGQRLPLVGTFFSEKDRSTELAQRKIEQLTEELNEKNETIEQLTQEIEAEKKKTEELMEENRERAEREASEAEEMTVKSYKQIAKKLEGMFASKSALILSEMPPAEALLTLHLMHSTAQSQLLGKLPPEQAAVYTVLLKDMEQRSNHMPLLQAANEVIAPYEDQMREWQVDPAEWALMFANMQPSNAAAILSEMNQGTALRILRELETGTRAAILSSMEAQTASRFSQQLVGDS